MYPCMKRLRTVKVSCNLKGKVIIVRLLAPDALPKAYPSIPLLAKSKLVT
jgi:hypothetical protein